MSFKHKMRGLYESMSISYTFGYALIALYGCIRFKGLITFWRYSAFCIMIVWLYICSAYLMNDYFDFKKDILNPYSVASRKLLKRNEFLLFSILLCLSSLILSYTIFGYHSFLFLFSQIFFMIFYTPFRDIHPYLGYFVLLLTISTSFRFSGYAVRDLYSIDNMDEIGIPQLFILLCFSLIQDLNHGISKNKTIKNLNHFLIILTNLFSIFIAFQPSIFGDTGINETIFSMITITNIIINIFALIYSSSYESYENLYYYLRMCYVAVFIMFQYFSLNRYKE